RNTCGIFQICARQSDAKLVAATSKNKVCGSNRASKDSCELSQHFVSDRVTAGIVDEFKSVDIDHQQRQWTGCALGSRTFPSEYAGGDAGVGRTSMGVGDWGRS